MENYLTSFEYELAGKERPNRPDPTLLSVLDQASVSTFGPGAKVLIYSGAEDPGHQYGSIRHKTGLAADIRVFRPDGSQVRLSDEDAELFALNAKRSGIRGFGAGASYMGDAFHADLFPEEDYTTEMGPVWGDWAASRREKLLKARAEGDEAYRAAISGSQATPEARRAQYGLGDRDPGSTGDIIRAIQSGQMRKSEAAPYVSEELLARIEEGNPLPEERESFFDRLGEAAANVDFANVGQAPEQPDYEMPSAKIYRGRQNTGARALQRMGIASLA